MKWLFVERARRLINVFQAIAQEETLARHHKATGVPINSCPALAIFVWAAGQQPKWPIDFIRESDKFPVLCLNENAFAQSEFGPAEVARD